MRAEAHLGPTKTITTGTVVVALALAGVFVPTVTLPVPQAHAVSPDVDRVEVDGVDRQARAERGALTEALGHEEPEAGEDTHAHADEAVIPQAAEAAVPEEGELAALSPRTVTGHFMVAGVTWDAGTTAEVTEVDVRVRESGTWTPWQSLGVDGVGDDDLAGARAGTEPIVSTGADAVQVRVTTSTGVDPDGLRVDLVDPGTSAADATVGDDPRPAASADAGTGYEIKPKLVSRTAWGADESLAGRWPETSSDIKAVYVHHTAGTNSYRESQSAALVRGIYAYHTKSRGWPDIGYQFLVDKFGNVFQGRKNAQFDNPIGAQAGGYNTGTIGVSAMGNFDTARPTSALMSGLARVIAWKAYQYGIYAKGTTRLLTGGSTGSGTRAKPGTTVKVPTILMHRTTNLTACPGKYLAAKMPSLRTAVESRRKAAVKKYGKPRWEIAAPTRYKPSSVQAPVQWHEAANYRWKPVKGARYYQVLERTASWDSDMPASSLYWRIVNGSTSKTSITVRTGNGLSRGLAVRAVTKNNHRGPLTTLVRTNRPIVPGDWTIGSAWKKVSNRSYPVDRAWQTAKGGAAIKLPSANQVRRVVVKGPTSPGDGKLQVLVGSKVVGTMNFGRPSDNDHVFTVWVPRSDGTVTLRKVSDGKRVRVSQIALARW